MTEQDKPMTEGSGSEKPVEPTPEGMMGEKPAEPKAEPTTGEKAQEMASAAAVKTQEAMKQVATGVMVDAEANENDKLLSALAYASQIIVPIIVPLIMLLSESSKNRPFQRYHAVQSLGFLVAVFIYEIVAAIVFTILTVISLGCLGLILWILFFLPIIPALYYAYLAYQGKRFDIPWVTNFMRQQKWL
ncbi:MAG: DUF4870 domain-containing protein [Anaerolineae bacterium]|nr:DUF4870 domain-containing protein [Anaerolineae bacterium]